MLDVLQHYGVLGMKWGVRRYQNKDGSLTAAGRARLDKKDEKWAKKKGDKITETARKKSSKELDRYAAKLLQNPNALTSRGKLSAATVNAYNRKMAEVMSQKVSDLRSPSGKTVQFVAKRGEVGVMMALADAGYDMTQLKNGVWTSGGSTKGTRTDGAAGFSDPNPAVNNGSGSSPFDNLYPWSGMVKETRTGGVMVKEPKYWYKWTKTGKKLKLQIADGPVEGFHVDPVNMDRGDGLGELDFSYIGRYHCASGTYKSETNKAQQTNITRSQARSNIHNLGSNIWQMDFAQMWYVGMLFLVEFADWNGQTAIGYGCSSGNSKQNNGRTDSMQYHTGTTAANRTTYGFTQYRNIEGWWDNVYDWMDGCYYNSNGLNVIKNPAQFSDSANGVLVGKPVAGYPSDFTIPTQDGLEWVLFPSAANGSQTTYVPDSWNYYGSGPCLCHGGNYGQSLNRGPFYVNYGSTSDQYSDVGCRLQERPPKAA